MDWIRAKINLPRVAREMQRAGIVVKEVCMTSYTRVPVAAVLVVLCSAAATRAEPIVATYQVQVTEQRTPSSNFTWSPFPSQQFTLSMTFDPALVSAAGTGWTYGPASFSPVPLPAPAPPARESLAREGSTFHGRFEQDQLEMSDLFASAGQHESHTGAEWRYARHTGLISQVFIGDAAVPFTAETFPAHLVLDSPFNFNYWVILSPVTPSGGLSQRVDYRGFATLLEVSSADPVPDPATVVLVGSGLAMLARRRNRR